MGKREYRVLRKMIVNMVLVLTVSFLSGCSDSELEEKNAQLQQMKFKLLKAESINQKLQKELSFLRDNNKGLNVSLAKSELLFFKKHKAEFDSVQENLDKEREALRKEKINIEKEAYENAKITVTNTYMGVLAGVSILLIFLLILWFYNHKKSRQLILEKDSNIKNLKNEKEMLESEYMKNKNSYDKIKDDIEALKKKEKEGGRNQVVDKIKSIEAKRDQRISRIRGIGNGNE